MKKVIVGVMGVLLAGVVGATQVISLNFGSNENAVSSDEGTHGLIEVPGTAWRDLSGGSGSATGATLYDIETGATSATEELAVTWSGSGTWRWNNAKDNVQKGYVDDNGARVSISLANVPFRYFDVLVYFNSDNSGNAFTPVEVNGQLYTWDADAAAARTATAQTETWGATCQSGVMELGVNVLRVNALDAGASGRIDIRTAERYTSRGSVAAIQIVEAESAAMPSPDFSWSGVPGEQPAGWITSFSGEYLPQYQRLGPGGIVVCSLGAGRAPYASSAMPEDFTCSVLLDVADVDGGGKDATLLDFGSGNGGNNSLRLFKLNGTDNVQLAYCANTSQNVDTYTKLDSLTVENVGQGYHLYTITFSTTAGMSLRIDNGETARSVTTSFSPLASGFQLGAVYGGRSMSAAADNMGLYNLRVWNSILSGEQMDRLWQMSEDAVGTPVKYATSKNLTTWPATAGYITLDVPTMADTGHHYLGANCGTINIREKSSVELSALCFMNHSSETNNFTLNLAGSVNVTASNTTADVYRDLYEATHDRGILTGHWRGSGTYNITGVLVGTNAYWETVYSADAQTIKIAGGFVHVRGFSAHNNNSVIEVTNGGVLEFADFSVGENVGSAVPFRLGEGTVRAVPWGGSEGWTLPGAVTFTDAATGTTLDPNGLSMTFDGVASGTGAVTIADSSEAGDGTVAFASLNGFSGQIAVTGAVRLKAYAANGFTGTFSMDGTSTLDLGANRPEGAIVFAEGTSVVLMESLADENGIANLTFTGTPNVTMFRPDGATPIEDARVETIDGVQRIVYTPSENVLVSGTACWYDFEFEDYSYRSTGVNTGTLSREGQWSPGSILGNAAADFRDEHTLYTAAECYMSITYPAQWSAAIYATVPQIPESVVMTFGTLQDGLIGLIAGNEANEVLLVRTTGNAPYETLASMRVPNAATSQHLYVFSKRSRTIDIYLDGVLWNTYTSPADITLGSGFQIGSVHGSTGATGLQRFGVANFYTNDERENFTMEAAPEALLSSYIGMLRIYDTALNSRALEALASEFPYVSPNGLYARTLTGAAEAESWEAPGAWAQVTDAGSTPVDAPLAGAMLQIYASGPSALAVELPANMSFESLSLGGTGSILLKKGGTGVLMNDGKTTVSVPVTIEYGAASIAGGPLVMNPGGSVTFDYSAFPIGYTTPNQTIVLTGNSTDTAAISLVKPANLYGRRFELVFNHDTSQWQIDIARDPLQLSWTGGDGGAWNEAAIWRDVATGGDAGFIKGDTVFFADLANEAEASVDVTQAYAPAAVGFAANTTSYALSGAGTITTTAIAKSGAGAVDVAATVQLDGAEMSISSGDAAFHDLRGTVSSATVEMGSGEVVFGTAGTLSLAGVTAGAGRTLVVEAAEGGTVTSPGVGDILALSSVTLRKTGSGLLNFPEGNNVFAGRLLVEEGRVELRKLGLTAVTATREKPILVTGSGWLTFATGSNGYDGSVPASLPLNAFVEAADGGTIELNGNNMFRRDPDVAPTFLVNGGELRCIGANSANDIRVEGVELNSGTLRFTGETANWQNRAIFLTGGKLVSTGTSTIVADENCPNRLDVATIDVKNGKLALDAMCEQTIVKTGVGMLELAGGSQTGLVEIRAGGLKATETTAANNTQVYLWSGTTLDLSALTGPFGGENLSIVYPEDNTAITIDLGDRDVHNGDLLVAWGADGAQTGTYKCRRSNGSGIVKAQEDGLHFVFTGFTFILR